MPTCGDKRSWSASATGNRGKNNSPLIFRFVSTKEGTVRIEEAAKRIKQFERGRLAKKLAALELEFKGLQKRYAKTPCSKIFTNWRNMKHIKNDTCMFLEPLFR